MLLKVVLLLPFVFKDGFGQGYYPCKEGFYLHSGRCYACSISCSSCTAYYSCKSCKTGYYLRDGLCYYCQSGCSSCTDSNSCNICKTGYYRNGNVCPPCPYLCNPCSKYHLCKQCQAGHYSNNGNCLPCASECNVCSEYNGECFNCKDGYYLENGLCYSENCPPKCLKCKSRENCLQCETGLHGPACLEECSSNCHRNSCSASGRCYVCKAGFYGTNCSDKCSPNCRDNKCHQGNGHCYHGCIQGLTGSVCDYNCSEVCKTCYRYNASVCNECVDNRFGGTTGYYSCEKSCSSHCLNQTCSDDTGYCILGCVDGFWGKTCSEPCSNTCRENKCNKENGACARGCIGGYTGHHCKCQPNCLCDDDENCLKCKAGYSGVDRNCYCTKRYCVDTTNCSVCLNTSYYAADNHCCACNLNCKNGICASENKCSDGCKDGYYQRNCSALCSNEDALCVECTTGNTGDYQRCIQCQQGFYPGNDTGVCQLCPKHCENSTCDSMTGTCTNGCEPGWWGKSCSHQCEPACSLCARSDGTCTVCFVGKYLRNCSENCSSNCSAVNEVNVCTIEDGTCLYGCMDKTSYGKQCEKRCSTTCFNQDCDWKTGNCLSGCKHNYFGLSCENKCKDTCVSSAGNRHCFESNGTCIAGCLDGFYGLMCQLPCSKNCLNETCNKLTGSCNYGCVDAFKGKTCESAVLGSTGKEHTTHFAVGGGIGAGCVLVIVGVIVFVLIRKRRNKRGQDGNQMQENIPDNTAVRFSNNSISVIQQEQNDDVVYAKPNKLKRKMSEEAGAASKSETGSLGDDGLSPSNRHSTLSSSVDRPSVEDKATNGCENTDVRYTMRKSAVVKSDLRDSMHAVLELDEDSFIDPPAVSQSRIVLSDGSGVEKLDEYAYYNVAAVKRRKVTVDKLAEFVSKRNRAYFTEEFDQLPTGLIKPYTESQKRENIAKNRYRGLYPYDKTRVVLNEGNSDYINASYIDGYSKRKAYIASIGPTVKYMSDMSPFWIMVWQEHVGKLVMLTKLSEAGVPKCDQYWPEKECSLSYADICVTTEHEDVYADYTVRSFIVNKDSKKRNIVQVQFTAWPDKSTPDDVTSLIEFRQKVNNISTNLDGPVLVHCSAGVGRTGTYIAIDSLTQEGQAEGGVDIYACVRNLREQRVNMVQTAEQYQYLHNAIVHTLAFDSKPIKTSKFHEYMLTHTSHLENQYHQLQASVESRPDAETEAVRLNNALKDKNRTGADIPGENNRPRLYLRRQLGVSGYINALYINSFRTKNRFLVAQTPLPSTVEDFLTLIVQENVSCIVTMETNFNENKQQMVGTYYPVDSQPLKVGCCTVQSESAECTDQYEHRKLKIMYEGKSRSEEVMVTHIQFTSWGEKKKIPDDPKMFMQFVKDVEMKYDSDGNDRPILVHCLTGAEKSGLFCVVSILIEKTHLEQEISVVNTVRQVKNRRHKAIPNKEQYIFCHQCLDEYLHTFDTYSNFSIEK